MGRNLTRCHIECCVTKRREGAIPSPDEACGLFYYVPLHNIRYGVPDPHKGGHYISLTRLITW